jgi:hypothetical protein
MDGAGFEFTVVEYAVDGASGDKLGRTVGDHDAPELDDMDLDDVEGGDVDALARAIANQWTPCHPAATVWRVKVHTSEHVESRWPRDRRAFGRRVTGDGLSVETAHGASVTEAVDDPKAPVALPSDVVVVNQRTTASRAITADSNTGYDPCGLRADRTAQVIVAGLAFMHYLRRGHDEIAIETPLLLRVAAAFTELTPAI